MNFILTCQIFRRDKIQYLLRMAELLPTFCIHGMKKGLQLRNCNPFKKWCRGTESNRPHPDFQSSALPTELPRLDFWQFSRIICDSQALLCVLFAFFQWVASQKARGRTAWPWAVQVRLRVSGRLASRRWLFQAL